MLRRTRRQTRKLEEVGEQRVTVLGCNAFWVELHAMHGVLLVLQPHDQATALGCDLQAWRENSPALRSRE